MGVNAMSFKSRELEVILASFKNRKKRAEQKYSSKDTSLNQVPAVFNAVKWEPDTVNIDIGGGRYDKGTEYLATKGVENLVLDPQNRTEEWNNIILERLDKQLADTATIANVLNVIAEKDVRRDVIEEARDFIKDDGVAYFQIYEGDRSGVGEETTKGWQNNMRAADYIDEIKEFFGSVVRHGRIFICRK